jgi:glutamyl-tRNA reductase
MLPVDFAVPRELIPRSTTSTTSTSTTWTTSRRVDHGERDSEGPRAEAIVEGEADRFARWLGSGADDRLRHRDHPPRRAEKALSAPAGSGVAPSRSPRRAHSSIVNKILKRRWRR